MSDAIVIWTRVTPGNASMVGQFPVTWSVWSETLDHAEEASVLSGEFMTGHARDFTVKVDARGRLLPRVSYAYRFWCGKEASPVGHFRLPPPSGERLDALEYAIFSCSNWRWGYFSAYGAAAAESLDFVLHLGDWIYETGVDRSPTTEEAIRKRLEPAHQAMTLEDYRLRHAFYRTDVHLQDLAASTPVIAIWDDHEVANDSWRNGAGNHTAGNWKDRVRAALTAYHEWMPTREMELEQGVRRGLSQMRWRKFDFGDLATLAMLETRLLARTFQNPPDPSVSDLVAESLHEASNITSDKWAGTPFEASVLSIRNLSEELRSRPDRQIIGDTQLSWLESTLKGSVQNNTSWRLVAQPLVVQENVPPDFEAAIAQASPEDRDVWQAALTAAIKAESQGVKPGAAEALVSVALGRYGIVDFFDGWMGHVAERERFAKTLQVGGAASTVVYGGDSHNAWVGKIRSSGQLVANEFDGMSVSSPGHVRVRGAPPSLDTAAWRVSNPDLVWTDQSSRGFMRVHLNKTAQVVDYIGVNATVAPPRTNVPTTCLASFIVSRSAVDGGLKQIPCKSLA